MCYSSIPDTQRSLGEGYHSLESSSLLSQQNNLPEVQTMMESWTGSLERLGVSVSVCSTSQGNQVRFKYSSGCLHHECECGLLNTWAEFPCGLHDLMKFLKGLKYSRIWCLYRVLQSPEYIFLGWAWKIHRRLHAQSHYY